MRVQRSLAVATAAVAAACLAALVAVNERLSPSELLARGQSLYGYGYPGYHPYSYPYGGYPYPDYYPPAFAYGGSYYNANQDDDSMYQQYVAAEQYRQWEQYAQQAEYDDYARTQQYYDMVDQGYKAPADGAQLKVAGKGTNKLEYMGHIEMGGWQHEITGGNDGGYNAPYDINGDGQELDNWGKVATGFKRKQGGQRLAHRAGVKPRHGAAALAQRQARLSQLNELMIPDVPGINNLHWEYNSEGEDPAVAEAALAASPPDYVLQQKWGWYYATPQQEAPAPAA